MTISKQSRICLKEHSYFVGRIADPPCIIVRTI